MKRCARIEDTTCSADECPPDRTDCSMFRDADCTYSERCQRPTMCASDGCPDFTEPSQPEYRTDPTTGQTFPYGP